MKQQYIRHIRKAWFYNANARSMASCNHLYMGGMSQQSLSAILGTSNFAKKNLEKLSEEILRSGAEYCESHAFPWERVKDVKLSEEKSKREKA